MTTRSWANWVLLAVGIITIISGAVQIFAPGFELRLLEAELSPTTTHLFATIGMFMVMFGAVLTQSVASSTPDPVVMLWTGGQKLGASVAVALGVTHHIFAPLALLVASFDCGSGIVALLYWRQLKAAA